LDSNTSAAARFFAITTSPPIASPDSKPAAAAAGVAVRAPRVALLMAAVGDLSSSGGAERQFSDLHAFLRTHPIADVTLISARASLARLRQALRLQDATRVIALPLGQRPAKGIVGVAWLTLLLLWVSFLRRFDIVHICLPTPSYVPYAAILSWLPRAIRPRIVLNVIDCTLAHNLSAARVDDLYERQVVDAHRMYFRWVRLDGIYTWYQSFVNCCRDYAHVAPRVLVRAARFCFTNPGRFAPAAEKEQLIVFAGRLSTQKRPLLFVEAVAALRERWPELIRGWRFEMYGGGPLEAAVRQSISRQGLNDLMVLTHTPDLSGVFARSRIFVSTQALENFTSLAMLEAMAAANVIVAENVGQTLEFVRPGENGFLASAPTVDAFVDALAECLRCVDSHEALGAESRRLATEVHTVAHFANDIASFWHDVLQR
jgi:glycosyltransferase involved in cell wall biosynthesis